MKKEVFLVNTIVENLSNFTRTAYCVNVFGDIEDANAFVDGIKNRVSRCDSLTMASYYTFGVSAEPVSDKTYDTPQGFACRKVVYEWTSPVTSKIMRTTFEIERRQVF